jgi:hypothetical protein
MICRNRHMDEKPDFVDVSSGKVRVIMPWKLKQTDPRL